MPDLGPYGAEVLSAYAVTAVLVAGIVAASLWQSHRARARLNEMERRRDR